MSKKIGLTRRMIRQQNCILQYRGLHYSHQTYFKYKNPSDGNGMIAYEFAKRWSGRAINIPALQRQIVELKSAKAAFLFARDIEGANIRKLQSVIIDYGTADQKREFAELPGASRDYLLGMAIVQDVMDL